MTEPQHHYSKKMSPAQSRWRYAVTATLKTEHAQSRYVDWLFDGHVNQVCRWAEEAEVVIIDDSVTPDGSSYWSVQSIYWFTDQKSFEAYEHEGAQLLRAEGINFAHELGGIDFQRTVGWSRMVKYREPLS